MRTTDPDPQPLGPLGEKVAPAPTVPAKEIWRPVPGSNGVVQDADGRMKTEYYNSDRPLR